MGVGLIEGRDQYRSELVGADLIGLLTVRYAGRVWNFSTEPTEVTDADSNTFVYIGGLGELEVEESAQPLSLDPEIVSVSFSLLWPEDVALLVARGHPLITAHGEMSIIVSGGAWESRRILATGFFNEPIYGEVGEPVSTTIVAHPGTDRALYPGSTAIVNSDTWPTARDEAFGLTYPTVFGRPGVYVDGSSVVRTNGSPGIAVQASGELAKTLLFAGHVVHSTRVDVYSVGDDSTATGLSVNSTADGLGRVVSHVSVVAKSDAFRSSSDFWIIYDSDSGGLKTEGGGVLRGAGDICVFMLRRSTLDVDFGKWAAVQGELNRYKIDAYIDDAVSPWQWIEENILPLLPLSIFDGPGGLYPVIWRYDAVSADAIESLTDGLNFTRTERPAYERSLDDLIDEFRFSFARDAQAGNYNLTVVSKAVPATGETPTAHVIVSTNRAEEATGPHRALSTKAISSLVVYDTGTAYQALFWMSIFFSFSPRVITGILPREAGWLKRGDVVEYTDSGLHMTAVLALVTDRKVGVHGPFQVSLLLLEDIARDVKAT